MQDHNQQHYNDVAIRTATAISATRRAFVAQMATELPPAEKLFPPHNRAGLGVTREYEAMGAEPVSAALAARAAERGVAFEHLGITLGTVLHGVDLKAELSADDIQFIRDTLLERKVIFFRDQHLSENQQEAFGRSFGDLDAFPFGGSGENPYILEIRHGRFSPGTENSWHTDVTWMERPSLGSIAQCVEAPPAGGDTLFSDSHAAYRGLRDELKERVEHLHGVNDYRVFLTRLPESLCDQIKAEIPFGVTHPLVRTHPETGKPALYIHGGFLRHESLFDARTGVPVGDEASRAIVTELLAQHHRPEYICRFQWQPGSIAFWDNRAVQHYAASDYYPHKRVLRRVTVSGDMPYYKPASN